MSTKTNGVWSFSKQKRKPRNVIPEKPTRSILVTKIKGQACIIVFTFFSSEDLGNSSSKCDTIPIL